VPDKADPMDFTRVGALRARDDSDEDQLKGMGSGL
jgi:hypothetical protein